MTLTKQNVVRITTNEREIRRLLAQGFRELTTTDAEEGDTLALFTVSQLKKKLDERGVPYKRSARKAELVRLLQSQEERRNGYKNV